jgi:hypothetical protein
MIPASFATQALRPRDQLEAWRDWYAPTFDVVPKRPSGDGFPAEIYVWTLRGLAVSRTSAPSVLIARTKGHLRRDPVDHWVISYCVRGAHFARTAGSELEVPKYLRECPSSGRWDKNFSMSGRMSTGSSSSWRATHSGILRLCSMLAGGQDWDAQYRPGIVGFGAKLVEHLGSRIYPMARRSRLQNGVAILGQGVQRVCIA